MSFSFPCDWNPACGQELRGRGGGPRVRSLAMTRFAACLEYRGPGGELMAMWLLAIASASEENGRRKKGERNRRWRMESDTERVEGGEWECE